MSGQIVSNEFTIGMGYSRCCGVREAHNIYAYKDVKKCLRDILDNYFSEENEEVENLIKLVYPRHYNYFKSGPRMKQSAHILWMGLENYKTVGPIWVAMHEMLSEYIRKQNLGDVLETKPAVNGNTNNLVVTYVWTPKWDNVTLWWNANYSYSPEKQADFMRELTKHHLGAPIKYICPEFKKDPEKMKRARELGLIP